MDRFLEMTSSDETEDAVSLYDRVARLPLTVDGYRLEPLKLETQGGWSRRTTVVVLTGLGLEGAGEDVIYQEADQLAFQNSGTDLPLAGTFDFDSFSRHLDTVDPFPREPEEHGARLYRRWALESAALDLALRQAGRSLPDALDLEVRPLRFVSSLGLGDPPSLAPIESRLERVRGIGFKVDYAENWTPELIRDLAAVPNVPTVDLKGQYRGAFRGPDGDPDRYRLVAELLPDAYLEDPEWTEATAEALRPHLHRVTWDATIHSLADVERCPVRPRCINMKPSRFGYVSELFRVYEFCRGASIAMYGGGQYELGTGRGQAQILASLFHADAPNDLAPKVYNEQPLPDRLPGSPLALTPAPVGFRLAPP
jgi:L-alanine-DL-glutamate epimerase-like enolase superfamily enzyme